MRLASWFGGFLVAIGVAATVGAVTLARHDADASRTLTAARKAANAPTRDLVEIWPDQPHKFAQPTPSPSPVPTTAPVEAAPVSAPAPAPARPALVVNSTQQALINQDRAARGLGPLTWSSCLYSVAVSNARRIAAQGSLSHTNGPQVDLTCGLGQQAGENIGYWSAGINDTSLNSMFVASPEHYANILGPYHYVASAWVVAPNGYAYIAVEFS
jgi:uncharacterized protein YkwD